MNIKRFVIGAIVLPVFFLNAAAYSEELFRGEAFIEGAERSEPRLIQTNTVETKNDSLILTHYFHYPNGFLYAMDRVVLVNNKPMKNRLDFFEIDESSIMECKGDKVQLTYRHHDNVKTTLREPQEPLICAPLQQRMIEEYYDELLRGDEIHFYIFASEILRLVDMKVKRVEDSEYGRPGVMVLEMRPKSVLIKWLVGKTYYLVDLKTRRLLELHGFSTMRQRVDEKWEYVNMDFYYSYK